MQDEGSTWEQALGLALALGPARTGASRGVYCQQPPRTKPFARSSHAVSFNSYTDSATPEPGPEGLSNLPTATWLGSRGAGSGRAVRPALASRSPAPFSRGLGTGGRHKSLSPPCHWPWAHSHLSLPEPVSCPCRQRETWNPAPPPWVRAPTAVTVTTLPLRPLSVLCDCEPF